MATSGLFDKQIPGDFQIGRTTLQGCSARLRRLLLRATAETQLQTSQSLRARYIRILRYLVLDRCLMSDCSVAIGKGRRNMNADTLSQARASDPLADSWLQNVRVTIVFARTKHK
jgi:hypothetical protein